MSWVPAIAGRPRGTPPSGGGNDPEVPGERCGARGTAPGGGGTPRGLPGPARPVYAGAFHVHAPAGGARNGIFVKVYAADPAQLGRPAILQQIYQAKAEAAARGACLIVTAGGVVRIGDVDPHPAPPALTSPAPPGAVPTPLSIPTRTATAPSNQAAAVRAATRRAALRAAQDFEHRVTAVALAGDIAVDIHRSGAELTLLRVTPGEVAAAAAASAQAAAETSSAVVRNKYRVRFGAQGDFVIEVMSGAGQGRTYSARPGDHLQAGTVMRGDTPYLELWVVNRGVATPWRALPANGDRPATGPSW